MATTRNSNAQKDTQQKRGARITKAGADVLKEDTKTLVVQGSNMFPEDVFSGTYWDGKGNDLVAILEPTFKPGTLKSLVSRNNILGQCIEAMEVNIDGTGHSIDLIEGAPENEAEKTMLEDFFKEPYPGKSFTSIRRDLRNDLESVGGGYLEVLRNAADEVVLANHLEADMIRMIRLGDPMDVKRTVVRMGKEIEVPLRQRFRRFVQDVNGKKIYFKEFDAPFDLDRETGKWAEAGIRLPLEKRASEIIYFGLNKEPKTPYCSPRWINQMPSVIGSRKAEEHNLEFFDAGGIPPVVVFIQGGTLGDTVREQLQAQLNGKGSKHRAAIVEATSTSGTLDSAGNVQIKVERFGSERQSDSMFQNYDQNTEDHVRVGFRLPPIFLGKSADYNFATAYTAYMVAEAQVFYPERLEFDTIINNTLVKVMGARSYKFSSLPLTLIDVERQLEALGMVKGTDISGEQMVKKLNEITGLNMEYEEQVPPEPTLPVGAPALAQPTGANRNQPALKHDVQHLRELAHKWTIVIGMREGHVHDDEIKTIKNEVANLDRAEAKFFNEAVAAASLTYASADLAGLGELCGCALTIAE